MLSSGRVEEEGPGFGQEHEEDGAPADTAEALRRREVDADNQQRASEQPNDDSFELRYEK